MLRILFFILIAKIYVTNLFSQTVKITGNIDGAKDSTAIWFCKPVTDNPADYGFMNDNTMILHGRFERSFEVSDISMITIAPNKYLPKLYLIVCEGDSITINKKGSEILFTGNNAAGQEALYKSTLFKIPQLQIILDSIFKIKTTCNSILAKSDSIEAILFKSIDTLYTNKEISPSFYELIRKYANAKYLNAISEIAKIYLENQNGNQLQIANAELKEILKIIYARYDPFSTLYNNIDGAQRESNRQAKCNLIVTNILYGEKNDIGLWSRHEDSAYAYAPVEMQYYIMATRLQFNRYFNAAKIEMDSIDFESFKKRYPKSPYIFILEKYFGAGPSTDTFIPYTFALKSKLQRSMKVIGVKKYNDITSLIRGQFKNKAVFIDLWATWCGPCKEEFNYADSLSVFLSKNNIAILYISVDYPWASKEWKKVLDEYDLNGYHYFATNNFESLSDGILVTGNMAIPRYLLFDSNGKIIDRNALRPSAKEDLYSAILRKLKRKS